MTSKKWMVRDILTLKRLNEERVRTDCSCGMHYVGVPMLARLLADQGPLSGWYFECEICQSTLFIPTGEAA